MKYDILEANNVDDLKEKINAALQNGWFVTGGVHVFRDTSSLNIKYMQALIKEEKETE